MMGHVRHPLVITVDGGHARLTCRVCGGDPRRADELFGSYTSSDSPGNTNGDDIGACKDQDIALRDKERR